MSDPIDDGLTEVPLPPRVTVEDVDFAVLAVRVHSAQETPRGVVCAKDGAAYPCRLHRWGRRVLALSGLSDAEIDALIERADPTALPGGGR
ncbi:MAG TPA: hypothetical protein VGD43_07700 [Micromonospora sp.]